MLNSLIAGTVCFALGCYSIRYCLKLRRIAEKRGLDIFADYKLGTKEEVDLGVKLGLAYSAGIFFYSMFLFFILTTMNVSLELAFLIAISILILSGIILFILGFVKAGEKRTRRVYLGFRKEMLPLFLSDLVIAILLFYLFWITDRTIRWLFLFIGLLIVAIGLMAVTLKRCGDDRQTQAREME